ncbi:uncharacterized protein LOC113324385 [Papaver somniferum]|uniref:uncharacterized protein LOC113324385 n=1 Tax=Papaver somniferum TaxID=3469 RepID=UPI000E703292|nr:uncharacterized protein LOC113324385 [Papaver somniferum]
MCDHRKANLWLFWNCSLSPPSVILFTRQCITIEIGGGLVTGIHADVITVNRRELWSDLLTISNLNKSWLVLGDFNTKKGGRSPLTSALNDFNEWIDQCGLLQAPKSRGISDHNCLIGTAADFLKPNNAPFRFQKMWLSHPDFMSIVTESWNGQIAGNPIFIFMNKLKNLKIISKKMELGDFWESRGIRDMAAQNYHTMLSQKARVNWIKFGDANTEFFHTQVELGQAKNNIAELEDTYGAIVTNKQSIENILLNHFKEKFATQPVNISEIFLSAIPDIVNSGDNKILEKIPSQEEIKEAVFCLNQDGAPGPDSYTGAKKASQFRPIGLSNFCFKIFTKILTIRMRNLLQKIISPQQCSFIKGRTIHEQVLLTSKLVNEMNTNRRGGNVALKLDISQAYNTVSWDYLIAVLKKYGFSERITNWILVLLKTTKFSIMVNGSPVGKLTQLIQERKIQPMVIRKGIFPSHLFFVDDIFIFCNGCKQTLVNLKHLLIEYQNASGQLVSAAKSKIFVDGTSGTRKTQIAKCMNMKLSDFPDKYLGVLLVKGKVKTEHLWSFVEMLQKRLATWTCKLLNFQASLTLIKFVLSRIPLYNMSIYRWPRKMIEACERILRNFLWSGNAEEQKYIIIAWDKVCVPLEEGGLGIRRFEDINKALLMKLLWKILNSNEEWEKFFLAKYNDKNGLWISYYKQSSVWIGIKWIIPEFEENTR